jgi:hypothetical protein
MFSPKAWHSPVTGNANLGCLGGAEAGAQPVIAIVVSTGRNGISHPRRARSEQPLPEAD